MTNAEIKKECESLYESINEANKRLIELRKLCNHENTFKGNYSYGVGRTFPAIICEHCNEVVKSDLHF